MPKQVKLEVALMPQQMSVETVAEPPIPSVYTNTTRLMQTVYDFRLIFSEGMMRGDLTIVQVDRVSVAMSPQHLKKLVKTLIEKLAEYEQKYGQIPEESETESTSA